MSETNTVESIVAKVDEIQKSISNFATEEKVKALGDQFANFQRIKDAQRRADMRHKTFGDQATFDTVANLMGKELVRAGKIEEKQLGEWVTKTGANLNQTDSGQGPGFIPTLVDPIVSKLVLDWGLARKVCRIRPGVHGNVTINKRNVRVTVSGQSRPDATITPAGSTYTNVTLSTHEATAITTVEEKLIWDAPIAIVEEALNDLAEAAAQLEDSSLFVGDGTAAYLSFTGLKTATGVGEVTEAATGGYGLDDIFTLQTTLHASAMRRPSTAIYMHPFQFAYMQKKKNSQNSYYFDVQTNSWKVGGYNVNFSFSMDSTQAATDVPVILADMDRAVVMGLGRPAEIRVLTEKYADINSIGIRLTYDVGYLLVQPTLVGRVRLT